MINVAFDETVIFSISIYYYTEVDSIDGAAIKQF